MGLGLGGGGGEFGVWVGLGLGGGLDVAGGGFGLDGDELWGGNGLVSQRATIGGDICVGLGDVYGIGCVGQFAAIHFDDYESKRYSSEVCGADDYKTSATASSDLYRW